MSEVVEFSGVWSLLLSSNRSDEIEIFCCLRVANEGGSAGGRRFI